MKKAAIALILLAVVGLLFSGTYQVMISNAATGAVVTPQAADFGYDNSGVLDIGTGTQGDTLPAFEVFNRYSLNAILSAQPSVNGGGLVVNPVADLVPPYGGIGPGHIVNALFKGVAPGTYTVTWQVTAQIGFPGTGLEVNLIFNTTVKVHDADGGG